VNNTHFLQGKKFLFSDLVFLRVQPPRAANRGAALPVSMYYAVEWLGRGGDGNSSSSFCTWGGRAATTAAVSELQGLIKGVVLALVKVQPEAVCRTCCLDGIIESSNLAKKFMHRISVATAASKKSNSKFWLCSVPVELFYIERGCSSRTEI
jgi:hypothetical protein